jgi:hypothetical protein
MTTQPPVGHFTRVEPTRWTVRTGPNAIWLHDKLDDTYQIILFAENISNSNEKLNVYIGVCKLLNVMAADHIVMKEAKQEIERLQGIIEGR